MPAPYFGAGWPPYESGGERFDLSHLHEFSLEVVDSAKVSRLVAVTFSDHCFTERRTSESPDHAFPGSDRRFSLDRYACSIALPGHIREAAAREVWNVESDKFAVLPLITISGIEVAYRIIVSVHRVKNLPVKLRVHVETAYPADPRNPTPFATYGSIRFPHLVRSMMDNKKIQKNHDRHRSRPRIA